MDFDTIDSPTDCTLVISFCDPTGFAKACQAKSSKEIFHMMSRYFELAGDIVEPAGGKIVKFIGDAILIVFPKDLAKQGIATLKELQEKVGRFFKDEGFDCVLQVRAHMGPVTCGRVGTRKEKHFDVFGDHVNLTARLPRGDFVMSPELEKHVTS